MMLFPGLFLLVFVLAVNMTGDSLRDALDPKLKR
jgi:ABC-type dipeptide/oligopeptide/nickel transport system permease subunit